MDFCKYFLRFFHLRITKFIVITLWESSDKCFLLKAIKFAYMSVQGVRYSRSGTTSLLGAHQDAGQVSNGCKPVVALGIR